MVDDSTACDDVNVVVWPPLTTIRSADVTRLHKERSTNFRTTCLASCSLGKLCTMSDHLPVKWLLLLDETTTSARASLVIRSTSCIGNHFSILIIMHATMMFSSAISFSLDTLFPDDLGSLLESFYSSHFEWPHGGMSASCFPSRSWKGGPPNEEL
ncbi:hypothetical protein BHE74_00043673 [Ensete ventricosum]|nr:hypothetical protein BHE74_00043673 [Ensete ventricosum]